MRLTVDKIIALGPCDSWDRARVDRYFGERRFVLHTTALRDQSIHIDDRIWLAIALLSDRSQRLFACDCAERALNREREVGREPDERSWDAVAVSRHYADGLATDDELTAARDAAWDAAWAAAGSAARDAARAAASAAAWDAEKRWQIERALEYLGGVAE